MTFDRLLFTTSELTFLAAIAAIVLTTFISRYFLKTLRAKRHALAIERAKKNATAKPSSWVVLVDDNFHFMDDSERYRLGVYRDYDLAVAACKSLLRDELKAMKANKPRASAKELYSIWSSFGESPFVEGGGFLASVFVEEETKRLTRFRYIGL